MSVNQVRIGSDNGLSPIRRQAIIPTNAGLLSIRPLKTNFSEILIKIQNFSFAKMHLKMLSVKRQPFVPGRWVNWEWPTFDENDLLWLSSECRRIRLWDRSSSRPFNITTDALRLDSNFLKHSWNHKRHANKILMYTTHTHKNSKTWTDFSCTVLQANCNETCL